MPLPNYRDGSIVNLMGSIMRSFGARSKYQPLKGFNIEALKKSKHVVLVIIDGMGYEYLVNKGKGSFLHRHLHSKMTSVFPTSTAPAVTAFNTGAAPAQHGVIGWFMYLKELGMVTLSLPFRPRNGGKTFGLEKSKKIFTHPSIPSSIRSPSFRVMGSMIIDSDYSLAHAGKSTRLPYKDLKGFFAGIRKATSSKKRAFTHAYWSEFDHLCHMHGPKGSKPLAHFKEIDRGISKLVSQLKGTGTTLIITADHGQIDCPKNRVVHVKDHPLFAECLSIPLCGEPRAAFCYVKPSKTSAFESYVKKHLTHACSLHRSEDLINEGYFGEGKPVSTLRDRVGDYTLLMKENYVIWDALAGEEIPVQLGTHGGLSEQEMYVPLVLVRT